MIQKIEKLRLEQKLSKSKLARGANISVSMYYNYLKGANIPFYVVNDLITSLGFKLAIVKEV